MLIVMLQPFLLTIQEMWALTDALPKRRDGLGLQMDYQHVHGSPNERMAHRCGDNVQHN
jgi:hypothetical protein